MRALFWLKNARPVSLPQSLMPALLAVCLAARKEHFSGCLALLCVAGGCLAHLSMNLFDDYFDYREKETSFRDTLVREGIRARTAKCPYLVSGQATMKQLLRACILFGVLAALLGLPVLLIRGKVILYIVLLAAILGISYSGMPLKLSYRGLGELDIGVIFGPLLMMGVYYGACGQFGWNLFMPAISMGLLVTNILYTHSVLDVEADMRAGKATLAGVLMKPEKKEISKKRQMAVLRILLMTPYVLTVIDVILHQEQIGYLLVFFTFPMAVELYQSVKIHMECKETKVKRKKIAGPMANWESICEAGLDWFMYRWYLARNLLMAFAFLVAVAEMFVMT